VLIAAMTCTASEPESHDLQAGKLHKRTTLSPTDSFWKTLSYMTQELSISRHYMTKTVILTDNKKAKDIRPAGELSHVRMC
jgi:hypothetical protein